MDSSTGGGKYAVFFAPKSPDVGREGSAAFEAPDDVADAKDNEVVDDDREGVIDQSVEGPEAGDWGVGGEGRSTPSMSPSRVISPSSSSVEGKKLRKRASACHFDAFLNSTQTSIRPGRERAGSRRSRWLVVLMGGIR